MSNTKKTKMTSMTRTMAIAPESIDTENRTVEVVWTTGARAVQWNWELGEFFEELEVSENAINMERLASGSAPFLNMHDGWRLSAVLGVVEKAWIDGAEGRAIIRFAKGDEDIDKIWNLVAQRIDQLPDRRRRIFTFLLDLHFAQRGISDLRSGEESRTQKAKKNADIR